jgi:hypothetical protein
VLNSFPFNININININVSSIHPNCAMSISSSSTLTHRKPTTGQRGNGDNDEDSSSNTPVATQADDIDIDIDTDPNESKRAVFKAIMTLIVFLILHLGMYHYVIKPMFQGPRPPTHEELIEQLRQSIDMERGQMLHNNALQQRA